MKLGIALFNTNSGNSQGLDTIDPAVKARVPNDTRSYINTLENFDGTGKTVILLHFLGLDGYLVGVIKARSEGSGRVNDNTTAWIHIPARAEISGEETVRLINFVEREISALDRTDTDRIREEFNQDYLDKGVLCTPVENITSPKDGNIAFRYYGENYQLYDLLGNGVCQKDYDAYQGVFLIDKASGISSRNPQITTLVFPAVRISFGDDHGFEPYWGSRKIMDPVEIRENTQITLIWKKHDYEDICKQVLIGSDIDKTLNNAAIRPDEIKIYVLRSWFRVTIGNAEITEKCVIRVNGTPIGEEKTPVAEAGTYEVEISCRGYETENGQEVYRRTYSSLPYRDQIRFKAKSHKETYILPRNEGNDLTSSATVTIETTGKRVMPLKDYALEGKKLRYTGNTLKIRWFLIGALTVLVIVLIVLGIRTAVNYEPAKEKTTTSRFSWFTVIFHHKTVKVDDPPEQGEKGSGSNQEVTLSDEDTVLAKLDSIPMYASLAADDAKDARSYADQTSKDAGKVSNTIKNAGNTFDDATVAAKKVVDRATIVADSLKAAGADSLAIKAAKALDDAKAAKKAADGAANNAKAAQKGAETAAKTAEAAKNAAMEAADKAKDASGKAEDAKKIKPKDDNEQKVKTETLEQALNDVRAEAKAAMEAKGKAEEAAKTVVKDKQDAENAVKAAGKAKTDAENAENALKAVIALSAQKTEDHVDVDDENHDNCNNSVVDEKKLTD